MGNYAGVKCPVCNKRFGAADDVVVCPLCGAPHHRDCYADRGECAFTKDHITGREWRPPPGEGPEENSESSAKTCHRCGSASPHEALFCQICGQSLNARGNQSQGHSGQPGGFPPFGSDPYNRNRSQNPYERDPLSQNQSGKGGYQQNPYSYGGYGRRPLEHPPHFEEIYQNETVSKLPAKDVAVFLGANHAHFIARFQYMERTGKVLQPNIYACFFNFFYYFYRKMYGMGVLMLAAFMVCTIPFFLFSWEIMPQLLHQYGMGGPPAASIDMARAETLSRFFLTAMFANFIFSLIVSLFANWLYHKHTILKVRDIMGEHAKSGEYQNVLAKAGGVDRLSTVLVGVLVFLGSNVIISIMIYSMNVF
ncbi:MAG: hypothetical protein FWE32_10995 [Oscillospiraceae bacterium]|nr:hypothetical protein [Oscillospiraceae bacterium]